MTLVPTYTYQQHIMWNIFNKCIKSNVQIKYKKAK